MLKLLLKLFGLFFRTAPPAPVPQPPLPPDPIPAPPPPPEPTPGEKLYEYALTCLGKDLSPKENEYACAETVSNILHAVFPEFPREILSTYDLYTLLERSADFERVTQQLRGDIIISPTGLGTGNVPHGHVGIFGEGDLIMSNDSATGKFKQNYTLAKWVERYRGEGGYPIYFFRRV